MKRPLFLTGALVLVFFSWSCSAEVTKEERSDRITIEIDADTDELKADLEEGMEDVQEGLQEGLAGMTEGLSEVLKSFSTNRNGERLEAADFRDLKAILPERLLRMDRSSFSGERSGLKGLKVAVAEATYEDDDRQLNISIVDGGGLPLAGLAQAGWSMVDIDKEDHNGYERTTLIDGNKAFEKYSSKWEEGELAVLYKDRFIISIKGKGIKAADLRRALDKLALDELEDL